MAVSEEVKARRKATNARWKALYKAAHGTYPELDVRLSEDEDLDSKFVQEDGEADEQAPTDERQRVVLLMQIMVDGNGPHGVGFVSDGVLEDPTKFQVFEHLERLGKPLGLDNYVETYLYTAEDDGHDGSLYTLRGVAIMTEKCWQERGMVKDSTSGEMILYGAVAWAVEWGVEDSGFEQHCVVGFFASEQEAQARAARLLRGDPDNKRHDFSEGTRRVKPYELRGNQRVRPKEVWACLLSAQGLCDVVHAVFDNEAYWEKREGWKLPDLSHGMVDAPDREHGIEVRRFRF